MSGRLFRRVTAEDAMNRKRFFLTSALIFTLLITQAAYALLRESTIDYFYDDAFVAWVGYSYIYCDGTVDTNNRVGSFRIWDQYRCSDGVRVSHKCQQTDGMGGWINCSCPAWDP